jgi:outer membrane protein OmpA-like peptidoglycan-associated protein
MHAMKAFLRMAGGIVLGTLATACATAQPPMQAAAGPRLPNPGPSQEFHVKFPEEKNAVARYIHLTLGEDLAADCGLSQTHFEFDSAEPLAEDQLALRALAQCLGRPDYAGVELSLVGRADRRGAPDYNQNLALRRASRVKELLIDAGMAADRIRTDSRGDRDAVGDDTLYSYGYDRRVDALVNVVHAPR